MPVTTAPAIIKTYKPEDIAAKLPDCPTDKQQNADFRGWIQDREQYEDYRAAFYIKASKDVHWWMGSYCWTKDPKWHTGVPHVPFIPYVKQREYIDFRRRHRAQGRPHLLVKSREQGASLCVMYDNQHHWQFTNAGNCKIGSEKAEKVDGRAGFGGTLLGKMDYNLSRQPEYLLPAGYNPKQHRIKFHFTNPVTGNVTTGETTNEAFAVGDRQDSIDIDEASLIGILEQIHTACGNATRAWCFLSTPRGYEYFAKLVHGGQVDVFMLKWWENEAWHGYTDPRTGLWMPGLRTCEAGHCPIHDEGGRPHSDRYDSECASYGNDPVKIAQEFDLNFAKSGGAVFNVERVNRVISLVTEKIVSSEIEFRHYKLDFVPVSRETPFPNDEDELYIEMRKWPVRATRMLGSPLKVYKEPFICRDKKCKCEGTGRHVYVIAGDTSQGKADGDGAGALVWDCTAGECVAVLHGRFEPVPLAREIAKLAKWYGTSSGDDINAWCAVEANGDGFVVNDILNKMGLWLHKSKSDDKIRKKRANVLGVVVHQGKTAMLNKHLVPRINGGESGWPEFVCPFPEVWQQFLTFISWAGKQGVLEPDKMIMGAQRGHHDDFVMMAFHALYGATERYGAIKDVLRPPETRLGPVNYVANGFNYV
jgi:hypothetical protein